MLKYALSSFAREIKTLELLERVAIPQGRLASAIEVVLQNVSAPLRGAVPISLRGLPNGLSRETLDEVCRRHFGSRLVRASHVHLTGWKASWVFRVFARLDSGAIKTLVYKNAVYNSEHVPAVRDLPVKPGPPEYAIYKALRSRPEAALHRLVPAIYVVEELVPGSHYRYLIEDLGSTHRPRPKAEAIAGVVACLPDLHRNLAAVRSELAGATLLTYDASFREALVPYARQAITRYADHAPRGAAAEILRSWDLISSAYLANERLEEQVAGPVHGDPNRTNVLFARNGSDIRLIDWEWAGIGLPHLDLAAVIKNVPDPQETNFVTEYASADRRISPAEHLHLFRRSKLERALIDASFLAIQKMETSGQADFDIETPLRCALDTARAFA